MNNTPQGGDARVPGVRMFENLNVIDYAHFAKPRDARLPDAEAQQRQLHRADRAIARAMGRSLPWGRPVVVGDTGPMIWPLNPLPPAELAEFRARLMPLVEQSVARLEVRMAAREADDTEVAETETVV